MSDLQELTNELMQDPEFKKEYEAIQPEVDIIRAILDARIKVSASNGYNSSNRVYPKCKKLAGVMKCTADASGFLYQRYTPGCGMDK